MIIAAIDPGKHAGVALFQNGGLISVDLVDFPLDRFFSSPYSLVDHVVIEIPQIYPHARQKGDPNDLIDVAFWGGILSGCINPKSIKPIHPADWKGQRPKKIDNEYTLSLLSIFEREIFKAKNFKKSVAHNAIDAIGIGLWEVGRR